MTDTGDDSIEIRIDDEVLFRLHDGRRPVVYPDTITRVSYETGLSVLHVGTVWAFGWFDGVRVLELEDSTVVAVDDIDPASIVVNPTSSTPRGVEP